MKEILVYEVSGLGNKIFNLIICVYLKQKYNWNISYSVVYNPHDLLSNVNETNIFQKLHKTINFIDWSEGKILKETGEYKKFNKDFVAKDLENIEEYFNFSDKIHLNCPIFYIHIEKMYLQINDKSLFEINNNLINNDILEITNNRYCAVNIRYGDKLLLANNYKQDKMFYPIYTPKYYADQIIKARKIGLNVFIFTDSEKIVNEFIIKKYGFDRDNKIFLFNISPLESLYLMIHSKYLIMSHSTFSFCAYLFGNNFDKIIFATFDNNESYKIADNIISDKWTIINNKKYILNFDHVVLKQMIYFYYKHVRNKN